MVSNINNLEWIQPPVSLVDVSNIPEYVILDLHFHPEVVAQTVPPQIIFTIMNMKHLDYIRHISVFRKDYHRYAYKPLAPKEREQMNGILGVLAVLKPAYPTRMEGEDALPAIVDLVINWSTQQPFLSSHACLPPEEDNPLLSHGYALLPAYTEQTLNCLKDFLSLMYRTRPEAYGEEERRTLGVVPANDQFFSKQKCYQYLALRFNAALAKVAPQLGIATAKEAPR